MAITQSQSKTPASLNNVAVGRYIDTGTVTAFTITTGFKPRYVRVQNITSGDQEEWYEGMTAAHALKTNSTGTAAQITSLGITVSENGFTLGVDTDIVVTSEQLSWIAIG